MNECNHFQLLGFKDECNGSRLRIEKITLAKHFPVPTRKFRLIKHTRVHTQSSLLCFFFCCFHDLPPLRRFVLQACVQLYSEHGLPLRCDPGQQTLEELSALWAHTPRLLLFHSLREKTQNERKLKQLTSKEMRLKHTLQTAAGCCWRFVSELIPNH